uniref:Uncharacterized protein n=1 Tax=Plectus sambesii TaxID=2011161 RepID=A0A914X281_9BILA
MADEAISRKLTADGDGTGDDRRFQLAYKMLLRITGSPEGRTPEQVNRLIKQIELAEFSMRKQTMIYAMNEQQIDSYAALCTEIEEDLKRAQDSISEAKKELHQAKQVRKNRQEYDLMAKMIEEQPSRSETNEKLMQVKQDLKEQGDRQKQLEGKLLERRNNLHAFGIILSQFNETLKDDIKADKEIIMAAEDTSSIDGDDMDEA